jgi:hypothetical protein
VGPKNESPDRRQREGHDVISVVNVRADFLKFKGSAIYQENHRGEEIMAIGQYYMLFKQHSKVFSIMYRSFTIRDM